MKVKILLRASCLAALFFVQLIVQAESLELYQNYSDLSDIQLATGIVDETQLKSSLKAQPHKDWTFMVYIAADNDLRGFAARNIKQMAEIGSNAHINIIVQLDIRITGNKKNYTSILYRK